jgi:hypothetical protein
MVSTFMAGNEESMSGALLAGNRREVGILKLAPVTAPPHLAPLIDVTARKRNWSDHKRGSFAPG